ncbi:MAG TPA: hypothetical protein VEY06_02460, partial [Flavisolibacter sp.]|nr:hypothetical protein [Flavisolibacter sp.]
MRKALIPLLLLTSAFANGQIKEGKVVYERVTQVRRPQGIPDEVTIPPTRKDNFELQFAGNHSIWESIPNPEGENNTITAPGIVLRVAGGNDVTYFDFAGGRRTDLREILEREFLVEDTITKLA